MSDYKQRRLEQENLPKAKLDKKGLVQLKGIYRFTVPYRAHFIAGLVALVISSGVLMSFPWFAGKLIDIAQGKAFRGFSINQIALVLLGILALQSCFSFFRVWSFSYVTENSVADMRRALYEKYMRMPIEFFDRHRTGELMSRITADLALLQDIFSITLAELIRQIVVLLGGVAILLYSTPKLTFFMLGTFPVLVVLALLFGKRIRKMAKNTQDELANSNIVLEETLQSVSVVKAFTNEAHEISRYSNFLSQFVRAAMRTASFRGGFISFMIFAIFGGIVLVLWYGATLLAANEMTVGDLTSFVIYTAFIGGSVAGLGDIFTSLQKAVGASERVLQMLEHAPETNAANAVPLNKIGNIAFDNVVFAYPTRKDINVLKGMSFNLQEGEKIALVGQSGAGKSTITQLLLRFYQPDGGQILVNNQPVQAYDLQSYRAHIGIVPQEVLLFGGTIRENILYGKPNATEAEVIEAAKQANAWDFICSFPEGLETKVGERGVKLSGGQRQRIAIARTILKNPAILILDEATSSLDAESEKLVQQALERLMQNRTTIIIAHRLATIRTVDRILVLEGGQIAEQGTHEQLMQSPEGIYQNFIKLQFEPIHN